MHAYASKQAGNRRKAQAYDLRPMYYTSPIHNIHTYIHTLCTFFAEVPIVRLRLDVECIALEHDLAECSESVPAGAVDSS
jgi:hypothetical protein